MRSAVSKPSMSGMRTSIRITEKSWRSSQRSASCPDAAVIVLRPGPESKASMARSVLGSSSTISMLAVGSVFIADPGHSLLAKEPDAQQAEQLVRVDGFGDIIRSAGVETFLAIAFHRFGRQGEDRQESMARVA